jgi:hypothetical protein
MNSMSGQPFPPHLILNLNPNLPFLPWPAASRSYVPKKESRSFLRLSVS